jgi:hypothetical protein
VRTRRARCADACRASALPERAPRTFMQPDVVRVPRGRVNLKLAVLLLRSSYAAVDALDFVPMDAFQIAFWKRRAAEQEGYLGLLAPLHVQQGDLEDPSYLDFITFAQLFTIGECMKHGEQVFQETIDAEGTVRTVRRDPALKDNALLPEAFGRAVGDAIFTGLRDGFEEEQFGGPQACAPGAGFECAVAGVAALLQIFVRRGYAFSGEVLEVDAAQRRFRVRLGGAATLWAAQALAARGSTPPPEHVGFTVHAFLRASGWGASSYTSRASDVALEQEWRLAA